MLYIIKFAILTSAEYILCDEKKRNFEWFCCHEAKKQNGWERKQKFPIRSIRLSTEYVVGGTKSNYPGYEVALLHIDYLHLSKNS